MNKLGILLTKLPIQLIGRSSPSSNSNNLESSAVDPMPYTLSFGAFKLIVVTTSSIGFGAFLAKEVAQFLKKNKVFNPKEERND
uniref:Essential MCU regulator, mitochondrial n=1 Tax=Brugia malayi TaxID=6279 RepID=A0A0J9Y2D6_BRUMA|nr:Bm10900 [Brugia malayi]